MTAALPRFQASGPDIVEIVGRRFIIIPEHEAMSRFEGWVEAAQRCLDQGDENRARIYAQDAATLAQAVNGARSYFRRQPRAFWRALTDSFDPPPRAA